MFIEICVVLSFVVLAFLIVALVGYWTGANYYFKLNQDFVGILAVCNAIVWFFWCFIQVLASATQIRSAEWTHNFSFGIVGTVNMIVLVLFIGANLFEWFEQSRKYFWSKRGR